MTSITVSRNGSTIPVEVIDYFVCGGVQLAVVEALEGKPFVGGDKWPIRTAHTTVKESELTITEEIPQDDLPTKNILDFVDDECGCVLPEQSCPVCRAQARSIYPADEIPF